MPILIIMGSEIKYGAKASYEDGTSQTWTGAEGLNISGEALEAFVRVCISPPPVSVEIVELPIEPELPAA